MHGEIYKLTEKGRKLLQLGSEMWELLNEEESE